MNSKEVQLWLAPIRGTMNAELRFTEKGAKFPMADFKFRKLKN